MNEPIISPWLIYLLDVTDAIKVTMLLIAVVSGVIAIFALCARDCDLFAKRVVIIFIVSCTLAIFVPSERVIYKMIIVSHVTPANIQKAGDSIDTVIDKAIEKMQKIQKLQIDTNPK